MRSLIPINRPLLYFVMTSLALAFTPGFALADTAVMEESKTESISIFDDGELQVPAEFERVERKSRIIEHEFQASDGEGEDAKTARITMMASGGGVKANIDRWKGQFTGGDEDLKKVEEMKIGEWHVHLVANNGTFAERMGGGPFAGGKVVQRKGHGMLGAILVHPEGKMYFVKMIGPNSLVQAKRDTFVEMLKSLEAK